ncbi:hypothetical protein E8E14_001274 [Neopestalotiopsis sp. 37M]|nr:hypothetical protein E8E14_001274 [Neopestalotiopsis sp. 37M]
MRVCGFLRVDPVSRRPQHIPLARTDVHTTILASASRTILTQTFVNSRGDAPELRYNFPLYDGVSVVGFTCTIGDRVITGVVKEKAEARQVYDEAVARGETAGLLDQLPEASDCFTTTIGNVPGGAEIKVEIVYIGELKHDAQVDGVRFTIPTNIAPRYGGQPMEMAGTQSLADGSISITVDAEAPAGSHITSIQSPSHQLAVTLGKLSTTPDAEPSFQRASATLSLGTAQLTNDFILQVKTTNAGEPVAVLEEHSTIPNQRALMVTLVPKFELPLEKPEIVFMCDRSGSMGGKEEDLRSALRIFVKSMRTGMKFNICSFGSNHTFLWERSQPYNQATVDEAMRHIDTIQANYGGTEMYHAVKDIFGRRYQDVNLEVFLLTDGQIWNQEQLLQLINQQVSESNGAIRLFSLGIGSGASHSLIEGVARAGQGFSQSVADREQMGSKVVRMLKGALFPHVKDYSLELKGIPNTGEDEFEIIENVSDVKSVEEAALSPATLTGDSVPQTPRSLYDTSIATDTEMQDTEFAAEPSHIPKIDIPKVLQAPSKVPPLFPFSRTTVYLMLSPDTPSPSFVTLRGSSSYGPLALEIPITVLKEKGETIHQLAAKKAVGELEEGRGWIYDAKEKGLEGQSLKQKYDSVFQEMVKSEAVRLGVQYQVGGKWCSFVATEADGTGAKEPRAPLSGTMDSDRYAGAFGVPRSRMMGSSAQRFAGTPQMMATPASYQHQQHRERDRATPGFSRLGAPQMPMQFAGASLFGSSSSSANNSNEPTSLFGSNSPSAVPAPGNNTGASLFGSVSSSVKNTGASLFGSSSSPAAPATGGGLFGTSSTSAVPAPGNNTGASLFGSVSSSVNNTGAPLFGSSSSPANNAGASLFGSTAAPAAPAPANNTGGGLFSTSSSSAFSAPANNIGSGLFGSATTNKTGGWGAQAFGGVPPSQTDTRCSEEYSPNRSAPRRSRPSQMQMPPASTDPSTADDKIQGLAILQNFEGYWTWDEKLSSLLGISEQEVLSYIDSSMGAALNTTEVISTVCAIAWLRKMKANEKDTWELIVDKALDWINDEFGSERGRDIIAFIPVMEKCFYEKHL